MSIILLELDRTVLIFRNIGNTAIHVIIILLILFYGTVLKVCWFFYMLSYFTACDQTKTLLKLDLSRCSPQRIQSNNAQVPGFCDKNKNHHISVEIFFLFCFLFSCFVFRVSYVCLLMFLSTERPFFYSIILLSTNRFLFHFRFEINWFQRNWNTRRTAILFAWMNIGLLQLSIARYPITTSSPVTLNILHTPHSVSQPEYLIYPKRTLHLMLVVVAQFRLNFSSQDGHSLRLWKSPVKLNFSSLFIIVLVWSLRSDNLLPPTHQNFYVTPLLALGSLFVLQW